MHTFIYLDRCDLQNRKMYLPNLKQIETHLLPQFFSEIQNNLLTKNVKDKYLKMFV